MKRLKLYLIVMALGALAFTSCSDADTDIFSSPVEDVTNRGEAKDATVSSLTFSWDAIEGSYQYGYRLTRKGSDMAVREGVVSQTCVSFDKLSTDTEYLLTVEAYGANGEPTRRFTIAGKTNAVTPLATPDIDSFGKTSEGNVVTISWDAVDNADSYSYKLTFNNVTLKEDVAYDNSVEIGKLAPGRYVFTLRALSDDENYSDSETVEWTFTNP